MKNKISIVCLAGILFVFSFSISAMSQLGGFSLSFDGTDDYVRVPDDPSLDMTDGFTIAAWIYLEEYTEWASIVTKGGIVNDGGILTDNNYTIHQSGPSVSGSESGHLRFTGSSPALPINPYLESDTQIPLHEWHYVAITYDGTTLHFYFDGVPDGGGLLSGPLVPNDDPLHIGADFPGDDEYWHGRIDELRIWNKALKPTHIQAAMNGRATPKASALVGYWRFDEGSGNTARDKSRETNHGTLVNGPTWVTPGAPIGNVGKAIAGQIEQAVLDQFVLTKNFPNPFNPETEIRFYLPEASQVFVRVFNTLGYEINTLVDSPLNAGLHSVRWDGKDNRGNPVSSGVYLYQVQVGDKFSQIRKMSLLK